MRETYPYLVRVVSVAPIIDLSIERCFLFLSFALDKKLKSYYIQQMSVKLKIFVNEIHCYFKDTRQVAKEKRKTAD